MISTRVWGNTTDGAVSRADEYSRQADDVSAKRSAVTKDLVKSGRNEGETKLSSSTDYSALIYTSSVHYPKKKLEKNPHNSERS